MANERPSTSQPPEKNTERRHSWRNDYQTFTTWSAYFGTRLRRLVWGLVLFIGLSGGFMLGAAGGYFVGLVEHLPKPTPTEMRHTLMEVNETSQFVDRNQQVLTDIHSDLTRHTLPSQPLNHYVTQALIDTEDENFTTHKGVVPSAMLRAALTQVFKRGSTSGGSTLTQQLVKQQLLTNERSITRKAKEMLLALYAEQCLSKDELLKAYLNVSPFGRDYEGHNIAGIETAAQGVFGVSTKDLTLAQASYLVGMPQNPYNYTPYTTDGQLKSTDDLKAGINRQHYVLERLYIEGDISKDDYQKATQEDITAQFRKPKANTNEETGASASDIDPYLYQALDQEATQIVYHQLADREQVDLSNAPEKTKETLYQHAKDQLANGGLRVQSSVDPKIYQLLNQQIQQNIDTLGDSYQEEMTDGQTKQTRTITESVQNGAVLMDNASGEVLAFVSGRDFKNNQVDHAFTSRRSPGSTLKPILAYAPALENGIAGPSSILPDTAIRWKQEDGSYYEPKNFGNTISNRLLTYRYALAHSLNNPTIYLYRELLDQGVDIQHYTESLGLGTAIHANEYKNMALPIGGVSTGPTVAEVAGAFAVFANGGTYHPPHLIQKITTSEGNVIYEAPHTANRVFSEDTSYVVGDVLREVWRSGTFASAKKSLNINTDLYLKTGTSEDFNDLWVAGSTPTITLVSWVGYDNIASKHTFSDGNQIARYGEPGERHNRYWVRLMNALNAADPYVVGQNQQFVRPSGVSEYKIVPETGTLPGTIHTPKGTVILPGANATTKELFTAHFQPPKASFDFAIQATVEQKLKQLQQIKPKTRIHSSGSSQSRSSSQETQFSSSEDKDAYEDED
ncbi:MAG: transglycosylase domain-containing protein [Aerococcus sp.]|nr:transglycosylase domain-containing protein [Aerococcus sp.]